MKCVLPEEDLQRLGGHIVGPHVLIGAQQVAGGCDERQQDADANQRDEDDRCSVLVARKDPLRKRNTHVEGLLPIWMAIFLIVLPSFLVCSRTDTGGWQTSTWTAARSCRQIFYLIYCGEKGPATCTAVNAKNAIHCLHAPNYVDCNEAATSSLAR